MTDKHNSRFWKNLRLPIALFMMLPIGSGVSSASEPLSPQNPANSSDSAVVSVPEARTLARIPAGTPVEAPDAERWNRVVFLARPTVSSGDIDAIPGAIREQVLRTVSTFVLTVLATIEQTSPPGQPPVYRLKEVGAGFCAMVGDQLRIVSTADEERSGIRLGLIHRHLLTENEKQLDKSRVIAHTSTLLIFDVPAIILRQGEHRDFVMRHFIWINSTTGRQATLVWLLEDGADGELVPADEPLRWLPPGLKENRKIHIDADETVFMGIPSERAFALEDLPPGKPVAWNEATRELAADSSYTQDRLRALAAALNEALRRSVSATRQQAER